MLFAAAAAQHAYCIAPLPFCMPCACCLQLLWGREAPQKLCSHMLRRHFANGRLLQHHR